MSSPQVLTGRPLLAGRVLAFTGIVLVALNMRTAVAGLTPLLPIIGQSYELSTFSISVLGAIAPLCFAAGGFFTPRIERKINLERTLILALLLMITGHLIRAFSTDWVMLAAGSVSALLGMGITNVAMPPTVRKYFPDRVSTMTAIYMSLLSAGTFIPPLIAVPVAQALSWRVSLAQWGIIAVIALIPWVAEYIKHRRDAQDRITDETTLVRKIHLWRSPTAWAIGTTLAVSSVAGYAFYAWLPLILQDLTGISTAEAGALLALFAALGLPVAFFTPTVASRMKEKVYLLVWIASALLSVGYLGLLLFPATLTWLWVSIVGIGCIEFPLSLLLVNLRTENQRSSMAMSGFAQFVAYLCAAAAPPLMGLSHSLSGSWSPTLWGLLTFCVVLNVPVALILKRNKSVDSELRDYSSSHLSAR